MPPESARPRVTAVQVHCPSKHCHAPYTNIQRTACSGLVGSGWGIFDPLRLNKVNFDGGGVGLLLIPFEL